MADDAQLYQNCMTEIRDRVNLVKSVEGLIGNNRPHCL